MEDIELKETPERNYSKEFEEEDDDYDDKEDGLMETNFGVRERSYSNLTRYTFENEETKVGKNFQTNVQFLFDKLVFLEDECKSPNFIDYLIKTQDFEITTKKLQTILLVLWNMNLNIMENHTQMKMV